MPIMKSLKKAKYGKNEFFKAYIEDEIHVMLQAMDDRVRTDPDLRREKALEWIQKNAATFRKNWKPVLQNGKRTY